MADNTIKAEYFDFNRKAFEADMRRNLDRRGSRGQRSKCRAFVFGPGDDRSPSKEFRFLAEHIGAPNVYTKRGEWPVLDKAFDKMNREIVAAKREALEAGLRALGYDPVQLKIKFSRKAGCSCGCSPGFILEDWQFDGQTLYIGEVGR